MKKRKDRTVKKKVRSLKKSEDIFDKCQLKNKKIEIFCKE